MSGVVFAGMGAQGDPVGIPVVLSPVFYDGEVYVMAEGFGIVRGTVVVIGTRMDNTEWCRREALQRVHAGLSDVLRWLGEPQYHPPRPHAELLRSLGVGVAHGEPQDGDTAEGSVPPWPGFPPHMGGDSVPPPTT